MRRIVLKKNTTMTIIFYLFLLFPFFKPSFFTTIPIINRVYNLFQILNFLIIILITIKERKISKINLLISGFIILLLISTLINNGNIEEVIVLTLKVISLCFLVDYGMKKDIKEFLKAFELLLSILIYINFITLFLYTNGMYVNIANGYKSNWFLGFKNSHILYILPAILLSIINSYMDKEKLSIRTLFLLIISLFSVILVKSSTSIVAIIMLVLFLIFKKVVKKYSFNLKHFVIYYLIAFFSIIILRIQNIFKFFIVDFLGKDLTFTGRIYIWDYVLERIKLKPIIGYGVEYKNYLFSIEKYPYYYSHNAILEILKQTGIIGLTLIAFIFIAIIKKLNQYKTEVITKTLSFVLFIYLIMMLMETYDFEYYFFLFPLCYNIDYIIKAKKEEKTNEEVNS